MIMSFKKHFIKILLIVLVLIIGIIIYHNFYNINNIATGCFREEIISPNGDYILKSYFVDGGSLSGDAMRVELVEISTKKTRNIYFNYPENKVEMKWLDDETVKINEVELNILKDTYDWRKNR